MLGTYQVLNVSPVLRPFTAIGLCKSISQSSSSPQIICKIPSESVQQEKVTASRSSTSSTTNTDSLSICGSALGRGLVAVTPEMIPKHPHSPTERRSKAASTYRVQVAKEPLPLLVGCSSHLFSKKLMKVCSSAAPRPPRRFHTACSETLSRPVVNAVVNAHLH
ncbi:1700113H08Rik [Phodopus roborovskii]|uniref:1700113H08Rik protein n=1 Tax=Phodopus roborovskii TaxID=109678 RepID=A0AAV0A8C1_PHORO|nr:1700113H08Rik [Phodopus roborovskii]